MAIDVYLMYLHDDPKDIMKHNTIDNMYTDATKITGDLREACDIVNPVITFEFSSNTLSPRTFPNWTYVYIPIFQRYYFVTNIRSLSRDLWQLSLHCDVLTSHINDLRNADAFIDRQEFDYDDQIVDSSIPLTNEWEYEAVAVESSFFEKTPLDDPINPTGGYYLLTTTI